MRPIPDNEIPGDTPLAKIDWLVHAALEEEDGIGLHLEAMKRQLDLMTEQPDHLRHVSIMPAAQLYVVETNHSRTYIDRCRELTAQHRQRGESEDAVYVHFALNGTPGEHIAVAFDCADVYKDQQS